MLLVIEAGWVNFTTSTTNKAFFMNLSFEITQFENPKLFLNALFSTISFCFNFPLENILSYKVFFVLKEVSFITTLKLRLLSVERVEKII